MQQLAGPVCVSGVGNAAALDLAASGGVPPYGVRERGRKRVEERESACPRHSSVSLSVSVQKKAVRGCVQWR
eukprot:1927458-Rhodomonas_salina.1